MNDTASARWAAILIPVGLVISGALLFTRPPISQVMWYHDFADKRTILGVPNFWNVASNAGFLVVGVLGIVFLCQHWMSRAGRPFLVPMERWPWFLLFLGVGLTAVGSSYYHLDPNNDTLVWDRLPISLAFTSLFSAILAERIGLRVGVALLLPLAAAGVGTVLYWHWTDDLRPYFLVQFYPMAVIPLLLLLTPPRYTGAGYIFLALGFYLLAMVFEHLLDWRLFTLTGCVSGHTIKHLLAALATFCIYWMIAKRHPIAGSSLVSGAA